MTEVMELEKPRNSDPVAAPLRMEHSPGYRICTRCVMDTSDREIAFDENGVCNHCHTFDEQARRRGPVLGKDDTRFSEVVAQMKEAGKGREYDCIVGVSGGVDSTYVAYLLKKAGLRILAVHMDNGWNSELAVHNIERTLKTLGVDLHTEVLDWEEFKDIQLAFLEASVPDGEIPTDHAIVAVLSEAHRRFNCVYDANGANARTEAILPVTWTYGVSDWLYIRSLHKRFGRVKLRTFPHYSLWSLYLKRIFRKERTVWILDLVDYVKSDAKKILQEELAWRDYGGKHYESIYTRFFQGYILPRKFGIDKRRSHLSSLICSNQISREAALAELDLPPYDPILQEEDRIYVIKKLGITEEHFERIMNAPPKTYADYPNSQRYMPALRIAARVARLVRLMPKRGA